MIHHYLPTALPDFLDLQKPKFKFMLSHEAIYEPIMVYRTGADVIVC